MRFMILSLACLFTGAVALAQPAPAPNLGQCRDPAGRSVACASGAAATDAEAVPLGAKAKVIDDVSAGRTPQIASAAPPVVPARCRDGHYDVGASRHAACASHHGVARTRRVPHRPGIL